MTGKLKWVILYMLLIAGLVMGNLGFGKTEATTIALATEFPTITDQVITSIDPTLMYEGDWEGSFTYAEPKLDAEGKQVLDWVGNSGTTAYENPKDMKVSLTLERFARNEPYGMSGSAVRIVTLKITKVWVSHPAFGTGTTGVAPSSFSQVWLPTDPPTNASNPSQPGMGIQIKFPNGLSLQTNMTVAGNVAGLLDVTADGKTLSGTTWMVLDPAMLTQRRQYPEGPGFWRKDGWSLTKVSVTESTEGYKLTGIVGDVLVRKGETGEWREYDQTILKIGDWVRTGKNSFVYITYADSHRIGLGPATIVKVEAENIFFLLTGKIHVWLNKLKRYGKGFEVKTIPRAIVVRSTEFTVSAEEDGTTTVLVLDGSVEVQDLVSKSVITLQPLDMVTLPKTTGGLTQQDMLARVKVVQPGSIDRWWEQGGEPAAIGKQPSQVPWTIVFVVLVAIILLVVGVLVLRLRRRHGRSQG